MGVVRSCGLRLPMAEKWFINDLRSMKRYILLKIAMLFLLAGCEGLSGREEATPTTRRLPTPEVFTTRVPQVKSTAQAFLDAWKAEDYQAMYAYLTAASKSAISEEKFVETYTNVANETAMSGLDYEILSEDREARIISYRVTIYSAVLGDIQRNTSMQLSLEDGALKIEWNGTLILPELGGGNYLAMDQPEINRGLIYDRNGRPLVEHTEAAAIGMWPDYIDLREDYAPNLLSLLSTVTGYRYDTLEELILNAFPGDYIPLGEVPVAQNERRIEILSTYGALIVSRYTSRYYYSVGPHVVGYVSAIQQEEMSEYRRKGYRADSMIGRKGIEAWGESILVGSLGGTLYVFNPDGKPVAQLGSVESSPGKDITTTIDYELQKGAQKAMSVFRGAIVVLERDTGRVLAMVSAPGFDSNAYQPLNYNWNILLNRITNDLDLLQFNRASQGQYPLGSVFKLITISAALESGLYAADTTYNCQYVFDELPNFPRYDWTYEHFQEDGTTKPSGLLTLPQGLIRSCNPYFWHIGLDLFNRGLTTSISDMATSFGLGKETGIEGVDEEAGNNPVPQSQVDAINLAIGQGDSLVTPLQVARFIAALGNGGTLYRPQLIEKISRGEKEQTTLFKPEVQGVIPLKPENLKLIQDAMVGVIRSEKPVGTAFRAFQGFDLPIAGKTGTATSAVGDSHAWFAGYSFVNRPDKPDIAVVVIAENGGEGAEIAAPIFRRVMEIYFYGRPLRPYRWEATFDVTRSPTPIVTFTPTPVPVFVP